MRNTRFNDRGFPFYGAINSQYQYVYDVGNCFLQIWDYDDHCIHNTYIKLNTLRQLLTYTKAAIHY